MLNILSTLNILSMLNILSTLNILSMLNILGTLNILLRYYEKGADNQLS